MLANRTLKALSLKGTGQDESAKTPNVWKLTYVYMALWSRPSPKTLEPLRYEKSTTLPERPQEPRA